jgi:hypothetical protein
MDSTADHHVWEFRNLWGGIRDRPHWFCTRCGSKVYSETKEPSPTKTMEGLTCNELIAHVVMDT